jgi:hypothetical protein
MFSLPDVQQAMKARMERRDAAFEELRPGSLGLTTHGGVVNQEARNFSSGCAICSGMLSLSGTPTR